jgi:DnaJ-class molecular chaperone
MSHQLLMTPSPTEELETCNQCLGDGYITVSRPVSMSFSVASGYIDTTSFECRNCAGTGGVRQQESYNEH